MKKPLLFLSLALLLFSGCSSPSGGALKPAASPTPLPPTSTPIPPISTSAPLPTDVPTPFPTYTQPAAPTPRPASSEDTFAFEQNRRLGRGLNFGNALEAPNEGEWGVTLKEEYFSLIRDAGFNSVRVPIRWSAHAQQSPPYTIDAVFFQRIDWVVEQALSHQLAVIIDMHHYLEIMENPLGNKDRFMALWDQIARHYASQPDTVYFELLNEPNGTIGTTSWSEFAAEAIRIIRQSNPRRTIIVGPGEWNSGTALYGLQLPEDDRNLIVTVHYYLPFHFTHQGAEWVDQATEWLGTTWRGTTEEEGAVQKDFDQVLQWANQYRRPIFLGEFGTYSKADEDSRVLWTTYITRQAEGRGFSWAYWEFCSGFGVYNLDKQAWDQRLIKALIP